MQVLLGQQRQCQFLRFVIVVGLLCMTLGHCQATDGTKDAVNDGNQPNVNESIVKKELNEPNGPLHAPEMTSQGQKVGDVVAIGEKSAAAASLGNNQNNDKPKNDVAAATQHQPQDVNQKSGIPKNSQTLNDNKTSTVSQQGTSSAATSSSASSSSHSYHREESILNSNEDISDSLQAGFYFFVFLSLSAILFIIFKVYRLRLTRAERKYGVQGDRSTQELTPLPIAIEDGPSDDEDQTLFEVHRQNIRIL